MACRSAGGPPAGRMGGGKQAKTPRFSAISRHPCVPPLWGMRHLAAFQRMGNEREEKGERRNWGDRLSCGSPCTTARQDAAPPEVTQNLLINHRGTSGGAASSRAPTMEDRMGCQAPAKGFWRNGASKSCPGLSKLSQLIRSPSAFPSANRFS